MSDPQKKLQANKGNIISINSRNLGLEGENRAAEFIKNLGYRVIEKNFRSHFGEIDIIARHDEYLVFIEVKLRRTTKYGSPQEAVNLRKQERMVKSALQYVKMKGLKSAQIRFDVLAIGPEQERVELFTSAFDASVCYTY